MMKFKDLQIGDCFVPLDEDEALYMKVFGHNLQNIVNEGIGGHAVLLSEGLLCFFHDFEDVEEVLACEDDILNLKKKDKRNRDL